MEVATKKTQRDSEPSSVAMAAQEAWRVAGESCVVVPWSSIAKRLGRRTVPWISEAVMVPRQRAVECVVEPAEDLAEVRDELAVLVDNGWTVSALLPVAALGHGRKALRGLDLRVQGWWESAGGSVKFATPETP